MFSDLLRLFLDSSIDKNIEPPKVALVVKNPPASAGDLRAAGLIPGWERPLEEGMATRSSILAWRIHMDRGAWGLQSMGSKSQHD